MSSGEVITIARTIYNEARGDGRDGMQGVAEVIFNRIGHPGFGNSPDAHAVVTKPGQFLGLGKTAPNPGNQSERELWVYAEQLAKTVYENKTSPGNLTQGAHSFHQSSSPNGLASPPWKAVFTVKIGHHYFFKITK